jgi:hypothetical protein
MKPSLAGRGTLPPVVGTYKINGFCLMGRLFGPEPGVRLEKVVFSQLLPAVVVRLAFHFARPGIRQL